MVRTNKTRQQAQVSHYVFHIVDLQLMHKLVATVGFLMEETDMDTELDLIPMGQTSTTAVVSEGVTVFA